MWWLQKHSEFRCLCSNASTSVICRRSLGRGYLNDGRANKKKERIEETAASITVNRGVCKWQGNWQPGLQVAMTFQLWKKKMYWELIEMVTMTICSKKFKMTSAKQHCSLNSKLPLEHYGMSLAQQLSSVQTYFSNKHPRNLPWSCMVQLAGERTSWL